MNYRKG